MVENPKMVPLMDQLTAEQKSEIEKLMSEQKITDWYKGIMLYQSLKGHTQGRLPKS
jgi:hypothetical protein